MKKVIVLLFCAAVVVMAVYHALIFYDENFRYGRMRETPAVRPHEQPLALMDPGVVPVSGGEAVYRATPGTALAPPLNLADGSVIDRGRAVYLTYCAQCHGIGHDGNGTVGQSFMPLPTDLRSAAVQAKPAGELFKSVSYGIPGGRQPPLETTIASADRWSVIAYVTSLGLRR